ncbi:MAG TPA: roadblock/LC7 domain-containing protein [Candidatus Binatia bacterium]|nr:roadblock/LC7 domain-containing protein [Candidatus Binatia bacterium]
MTRLAQVAGVDCTVLVDRERFAIEAEGDAGTDADALVTVAPRLAGMAAGIARDLGRRECSGAMVTCRDGAFLVRDVAGAAVIAMSFRDSGSALMAHEAVDGTLADLVQAIRATEAA